MHSKTYGRSVRSATTARPRGKKMNDEHLIRMIRLRLALLQADLDQLYELVDAELEDGLDVQLDAEYR